MFSLSVGLKCKMTVLTLRLKTSILQNDLINVDLDNAIKQSLPRLGILNFIGEIFIAK